jgi:hypothetical protein
MGYFNVATFYYFFKYFITLSNIKSKFNFLLILLNQLRKRTR